MRVLAFASQKAGAGKTTLAGHVAVQAQESGAGNVAVIDVDPEAHLADWCAKRADQPLRHVHATQAELLQKIEALQNEGFDLAVIDTPPALSHSIESVLQAADLVAIPTRPYGHDLEAANATAELARQAGKPFVFIVNGAQTDAELPADLVMSLAQFGPVATTPIPRSLSFVDAMIEGRTVADGDAEQAASSSVIELWKYLAKRLPRGAKAGTSAKSAKIAGGAEPALFTRKAPSRRSAAASSSEDLPSPSSSELTVEDDSEALDLEPPIARKVENAPRTRRAQRAESESIDASTPAAVQPVRRRSRWRWVKIAMAAGVALLLLAGVAAIIAVNNIDPRSYAGAITEAVEEATGRKLEINGDIDIAFGLTPEVVIEDITLANPKWSKQPLMASVERLEVDIRLLPLLFGEVKIRRIVLTGAAINLERTADGKDNWTFGNVAEAAPTAAADAEAEGGLPEINQVRIEDSKLVFDDQAAKEHREAEIKLLKLSSSGLDRTLEFDLAAILDGQPLQAAGEIDSLQALMDGGDLAVDVTLHSGESSLAAEGSIEAPYFESEMDLRIEGSGPTLAEIGRPFGVALAERGPFKISGAFTGGDKQYRVDELDVSIAQSDLKGTASLDMRGARPAFAGALTSEHLDLADIIAEEPETAPAEPDDGRIFSDDDLPFDALRIVDGDLTFDAKSFVSNSVEMTNVTGHLILANGVATLSPFRAGISGGQLDLSSVIDATGKSPTITLKSNADGISGNDLLGVLGLDGILGGGRADLALDLAGRGYSLHDIMGGLNGTAQLHMTGGYINDQFARFLLADMNQMIASGGQGGGGISCLVTSFGAKNGIATSKTTVIDAPGAAIVGSGSINLNKETIAMRFEPVAKELGLSQFAIPVDVVGPLASPSVTADAVESATKVVGTTAGLATDSVLGALGDAAGITTGQVSRAVPSCGAPARPATAATVPAETVTEEAAATPEPAPVPATSPQPATTSTTTKKKATATSSSSGSSSGSTLDQAGEFIGDVGTGIGDLFEGSSSSNTETRTNKKK